MTLLVSARTWPGWIEDGIPLTSHVGVAEGGVIVSDGLSGAIMAYEACYGGESLILAQRVDSQGNALWGDFGIVISIGEGSRDSPRIASDGSGGAIVACFGWRRGGL